MHYFLKKKERGPRDTQRGRACEGKGRNWSRSTEDLQDPPAAGREAWNVSSLGAPRRP